MIVKNGRNALLLAVLCLAFVVFPIRAQAGIINVPGDYNKIQGAINAAGSGDTVQVAAGTYSPSTNSESFPLNMKNGVSLLGAGADTTILNAEGTGRVITANGIDSSTTLDGFTITNGSASAGGGIYTSGSSWTISNCNINNNSATYGAGICSEWSDHSTITNCTISYNCNSQYPSDNMPYPGGGMEFYFNTTAPYPTLTNCTISYNAAPIGGGMRIYYSVAILTNCTITNNNASLRGGAMECDRGSAKITNCTIADNYSASCGGAISVIGTYPYDPAPYGSEDTEVVNSIIWGNTTGTLNSDFFGRCSTHYEIQLYGAFECVLHLDYSDFDPANIEPDPLLSLSGSNNINADPLFVDPNPLPEQQPCGGCGLEPCGPFDYHLQETSPCKDAGTGTHPDPPLSIPSDDIDGGSRPQGTDYDMGSDEYAAAAVCDDDDGDGYGECPDCGTANGCDYDGDDCNDGDDTIYPGATEITCNGVDENCNGMADDAPDSDGDGTPDCNDACPSDPNKINPGICGCDVPDTDSDGDGTPDCVDAFPQDPNEWIDTDGDGIGNNADPDDDNDDLPDVWEIYFELDPLDATGDNGKDGDPDNDGWTNYQEYQGGSNPTNPNSIPSAHRSTSYGVDRSGAGYDVGDCAHCHETFDSDICDSNELMLFAPVNPTSQTDNFCFQCHKGDGSAQVDGVTNYNYSTTFSGGSVIFDNMYDAFNPEPGGSSHSLEGIQSFLLGGAFKTATGDDWSLYQIRNPCDACHNPHMAQKNNDNPYDATKVAISRPSDLNNLWGDDTSERMNAYTSGYQAPHWSGGTHYEPADDSTQDGSNLSDYVTLCTDCHNTYNIIYSTNLGRNLKSINWGSSGDKHGGRNAAENEDYNCYDLVSPYSEALKQGGHNYVLACTDCHEPHGSPAPYLLRMQVNSKSLSYSESLNAFYSDLCTACHLEKSCSYGSPCSSNSHPGPGGNCSHCHYHGPPGQCYKMGAKMF